jgi:thiamine transport system substrate-binding protein
MVKKMVLIVAIVLLTGCVVVTPSPATPAATPSAPAATPTAGPTAAGPTLRVMTHDSFSISQGVLAEFEKQCGCQVEFLKSGDAGLALNKAILAKGNPLADAFYGVDNTFLSRALNQDICVPYASPELSGIPGDLKLDPGNRMLPVDYGYVTLNYDKAYFADNDIPLPQTLHDLTDPAYKGLLVVENPATSSPGLAFLLATISVFGEQGSPASHAPNSKDVPAGRPPETPLTTAGGVGGSYTYLDFWRDLRNNDVLVDDGWESAYYNDFSGAGQGDHPLVVSYATSPAAEVYFADPQPAESPTGNILPPGGSFRQVEFVCVLQGAAQPELARQWVDFMLGPIFQADIPLQMWVYPARTGTPLPEVFVKYAQVPSQPAQVPPEQIEANRERWLQDWTDTVLH